MFEPTADDRLSLQSQVDELESEIAKIREELVLERWYLECRLYSARNELVKLNKIPVH